MQFFTEAVNVLKTLCNRVRRRPRGLGCCQSLEGYGNDNPGAKSQGIKQLMAGGGVADWNYTCSLALRAV